MVGDKIILTLKRGGVYFASYNELLHNIILQNKILIDSTAKGRLGMKVHTDEGYCRFYFYDLAYACYHGYVTSVDDMIPQIEDFKAFKRDHNYDIDHADSNVYNNTILNLSLMDHTLNSIKAAITAEFVGPYHLTALYHEGVYRVQLLIEAAGSPILMDMVASRTRGVSIGVADEALRGATGTIGFLCENDREFVECLRFLVSIRHSWADKGDCTPREYYKQNPDFVSLAMDTQISIRLQEVLLLDKVSNFQPWKRADH